MLVKFSKNYILIIYRGFEIFCLWIIKKCININIVVRSGNIKVCKL